MLHLRMCSAHPAMDLSRPVIFFMHLWLPPPQMCLRYWADVAPLQHVTPIWVATSSCASASQRCSHIQTYSPHLVWPLRVQVCAPFTCGQFSEVSPIFICGPHLPRCTAQPSCGPLLPSTSIILPQIWVLVLAWPVVLRWTSSPQMLPHVQLRLPPHEAPPNRLQPPQPLPALPALAPPIPAVPPSCASPLPQMCTLPAPPHSPTRPGAASTSHNAPRRGPARPLLPGCPARPPASLPAVRRAAASTESPFSRRSLRRPPQPHPLIQSNRRLGAVSHRALREGLPHFTPFTGTLTSWRLQLPAFSVWRRRGRRPAPPLGSAPPPPAEVCARSPWREFGTAVYRRAVPVVTLRTTARGLGARQVAPAVRAFRVGERRACRKLGACAFAWSAAESGRRGR